jgi:hypothetical protein
MFSLRLKILFLLIISALSCSCSNWPIYPDSNEIDEILLFEKYVRSMNQVYFDSLVDFYEGTKINDQYLVNNNSAFGLTVVLVKKGNYKDVLTSLESSNIDGYKTSLLVSYANYYQSGRNKEVIDTILVDIKEKINSDCDNLSYASDYFFFLCLRDGIDSASSTLNRICEQNGEYSDIPQKPYWENCDIDKLKCQSILSYLRVYHRDFWR